MHGCVSHPEDIVLTRVRVLIDFMLTHLGTLHEIQYEQVRPFRYRTIFAYYKAHVIRRLFLEG